MTRYSNDSGQAAPTAIVTGVGPQQRFDKSANLEADMTHWALTGSHNTETPFKTITY
jgi:hypothetical protein